MLVPALGRESIGRGSCSLPWFFFVGWLAGVAYCYCCFVLLPMVSKEVGRVEGEGFDVWDKVSVWWCLFVKRGVRVGTGSN